MDNPFARMGARIVAIRKKRKISQMELAEALDISVSYMSKIENGKCNFGVDILMRITEVLNVSADDILRSATPAVTATYAREIDEMLSDCSAEDANRLIRILKEFKDALRREQQD